MLVNDDAVGKLAKDNEEVEPDEFIERSPSIINPMVYIFIINICTVKKAEPKSCLHLTFI